MDNKMYFHWLNEVAQQCRFIRLGHSELRGSLVAFNPDRTFLLVHSLLSHARTLSQMLWPENEELKSLGETLRSNLGTDDKSLLRAQAGLIASERADTSYKEWLDQVSSDFVETNIMPRGSLGGFKSDVFQRDLDPENLDFRFRGEQWHLDAIADEAAKVEKAVIRAKATTNPW